MNSPDFLDVRRLTEALNAASEGVVRVHESGGQACTGWLITPDLVVVPLHVLPDGGRPTQFTCRPSGPGAAEAEAEVVFVPSAPGSLPDPSEQVRYAHSAPVLLRLRSSLAGARPLRLAGKHGYDSIAFLLHYPEGVADQRVSFGRVRGTSEGMLLHDAASAPGSSGGPIVNGVGEILAMTAVRLPRSSSTSARAAGPALDAMLETLRAAPQWAEISAHHNLADVDTARRHLREQRDQSAVVLDDDLLWAAVRWSFDPAPLSDEERRRLASLVVDPGAGRWTLRSGARRRLIRDATPERLRASGLPGEAGDLRQGVIDRLLRGAPYRLGEVAEAELPYWLQAVRWFADVLPGLPTPAEVTDALEKRRLRSRLRVVAGPDFQGRRAELERLRDWYGPGDSGPMVVTGIGGIGKSALLARFALDQPEETLVCWLDFDRADLAADDADSVLSLLTRQVAVQIEGFAPEPIEVTEPWQRRADAFADAFAVASAGRPAPMLILDGFEVAQYARRHGELWVVLDRILRRMPGLRVVVSGRAPVPGLRLRDREADTLPLTGLDPADAGAWLRGRGVREPVVLNRVLNLAGGIPLALHLAVRYVESGGAVADLPAQLPQAMVEGLLYTRILERVMDPALMPLAQDALVLRVLTAEVVAAVLAPVIPVDLDAAEVFLRLTRELSLVTEDAGEIVDITVGAGRDELRLRPEVRAAALTLLEVDDVARVRAVDGRAAAFYERQDPTLPAIAELVYHRLRLGDIAGAAAVWRDDCAPLLTDAGNEIAEPARSWLRQRVTAPSGSLAVHAAWERDTAERIRLALGRENTRAVVDLLRERTIRDPRGPLILYDAWLRRESGDVAGAWEMLSALDDDGTPIGRDRTLLAASLAVQMDNLTTADRLLAGVQRRDGWPIDNWSVRGAGVLVWAARVRLTVDLAAELELSRSGKTVRSALRPYLHPFDVVLPDLQATLGADPFSTHLRLPRRPEEQDAFVDRLQDVRRRVLDSRWERGLIDRWAASATTWRAPRDGYLQVSGYSAAPDAATSIQRGLDVAVLGQRRLQLVTGKMSLSDACETVDRAIDPKLPTLAVMSAMAAFRSQPLSVELAGGSPMNIDAFISAIGFQRRLRPVSPSDQLLHKSIGRYHDNDQKAAVTVAAFAPDPLDLLVRKVVGLPIGGLV